MSKKNSAKDFNFYTFSELQGVHFLEAELHKFSYKKHSHQEYCIGVTNKGVQSFYCKGEHHNVTPSGIMTFNPEDAHDGHPGLDTGLKYQMLYIDDSKIRALAEELYNGKFNNVYFENIVHYDRQISKKLLTFFKEIKETNGSCEIQSKFYEVLTDLFNAYGIFVKEPLHIHKDKVLINKACNYIKENAFKDISLDNIAGYVNVSPYYFSRMFKKTTDLSPHNYLTQCRINIVKKNIDLSVPLAELALIAGFSDQSHMNKRFKEAHGLTVGQYKKSLLK